MPYMLVGSCVHMQNADGTPGAMVKCHDSEAQAKAHLAALEINVAEAKSMIKAIGDDRFGGYLVVWGDASRKDLTGEWFDQNTGGLLDFFKAVGKLPALYDHARDGKMLTTAVGTIDRLAPDDVGLWAEGQYAKRNRYVEAVKEMVAKGALSFSSGALPQAVKRLKTGYIQNWPIIEGSMTPMPAEPRFTHIAALKTAQLAYKSLGLPTDALPQEPVDPGTQDSAVDGEEDAAGKGVVEGSNDRQGESEMADNLTPEAIKAIVATGIAEELKRRDDEAKAKADAAKAIEDEINKRVEAKLADLAKSGKALPVPKNGDGKITVTRATKYSDLSAADMGFLYDVMQGASQIRGKSWNPGEAFFRETADKSFKAVEKGELPADAVKGLMALGFTKTDELVYSTQANYGDEWVPDSWRAELWMKVRQDNVIANKLQMVDMPTNPYELPIETTDPTVYLVAETTNQAQLAYTSGNAITESKPGTGKRTLTAIKLGLRLAWSTEMDEDSIIPVVDNYRRQSIRAMQDAIDNVCLNGDTETGATGNVNLVDAAPTAGTRWLAFNGFRKYCLVTNPTTALVRGAGAPTLALMRQTRFKLTGKYALRPADCLWIVGNSTYAALLNFPEFLTMDKIGPQATALTGQVGVIDGVPVVATAEQGLSQTGLYSAGGGKISTTAGNNVKGQAVIIFRPAWILGYRRQVRAEVERLPGFDAYHLVVTARLHMVSFDDAGDAAELYDLTV